MNTKIDVLLSSIEFKGDDVGGYGRVNADVPYWQGRAYAELAFARDVCERLAPELLPTVEVSARRVRAEFDKLGYVSKESVELMESELSQVSPLAKKFTLHCIGHSHIDMNWQWGYDETVNIVLSNLDATVALMKEFPFLTFGQSQASVYEIVEKYGSKQLLADIKSLIKDGRWEVIAANWVENDKNMPSGESLVRQTLYAKKYLAKLLDIDRSDIVIDFEPDTFGHNANMPKILAASGTKYLYFNRGDDRDGPFFTRWEDGEGGSIFCYRDTNWYNGKTEPSLMDGKLLAYDCSGSTHLLNVFGVGDHGGGPTRRDINRLTDMQTWPCYPTIVFSTLRAFFEAADAEAVRCPSVTGEKNPIFTGCYTTQTRIKRSNRIAERVLYEGEAWTALCSGMFMKEYSGEKFEKAWKNVLFNHFHDIITGSNVRDSREFALGRFQEAMAYANSERTYALRRIANAVDTSVFMTDGDKHNQTLTGGYDRVPRDREDTSFGAGAGFTGAGYGSYSVSGASGDRRVYTFFNPLDEPRTENARITLWDWRETKLIRVSDADGNDVPFQLIGNGIHSYWGHAYAELLVRVTLPALGYNSLLVSKAEEADVRRTVFERNDIRKEYEDSFVLENDLVRVELDPVTAKVKSYFDKRTSRELVDPVRGGGVFRYIIEDTDRGHPAWKIGRYKKITELTDGVLIRNYTRGALRDSLEMEIPFAESVLKVRLSLDRHSPSLTYDCVCDWQQRGSKSFGYPHLDFVQPLPFEVSENTFDIPFGTVTRKAQALDLPANSFIHAGKDGHGMMLFSDCKYGFRGDGKSLAVTLVHASDSPDPCPEQGRLEFSLTLTPTENADPLSLIRTARRLDHPVSAVCTDPHTGNIPLCGALCTANGAVLSAIKTAESGGGLIFRFYDPLDTDAQATVSLPMGAIGADLCDALENELSPLPVTDDGVSFTVPAHGFTTVKLEI